MENREAVKDVILSMPNNNLLIELPTGHGKTAVAIELLKKRIPKGNILVVVPRTVLKKGFMKEVNKWWKDCPLEFTLSTYKSLAKHAGNWDAVIYDEVHHFTPKCKENAKYVLSNNNILLSATVPKNIKETLFNVFPNLGYYKRTVKEAIDEGVLPDPKVYLLPLELDNTKPTELIIKNPEAKQEITIDWNQRWKYLGNKNTKINIRCTRKQFMLDLDGQIEWYKKKYMSKRIESFKNRWLKLCGTRLKVLSTWKENIILEILKKFKNHRTLTFCNGIEQTKILGKHCINSKNKNFQKELDAFNEGKIKHITACNMLNEGINLANCRIGIYAVLNSSDILIKQKLGRLLRHKNPIIIIPYFKGTREQELVNTMMSDYNPELISVVHSINDIIL